jgi:hypothetical protein
MVNLGESDNSHDDGSDDERKESNGRAGPKPPKNGSGAANGSGGLVLVCRGGYLPLRLSFYASQVFKYQSPFFLEISVSCVTNLLETRGIVLGQEEEKVPLLSWGSRWSRCMDHCFFMNAAGNRQTLECFVFLLLRQLHLVPCGCGKISAGDENVMHCLGFEPCAAPTGTDALPLSTTAAPVILGDLCRLKYVCAF